MTNELTIRQQLTPDTWKMIAEIAPTMAQSRLFGVASPEQAAAVMLKGFELGLSLTASFEFIHLIDGKPGLSPRGALALIQQDANFGGLEVKDITDANGQPYACRVTMTRKNGFSYTVEFNMEDAKRADLVKKAGGWEKYPANMLRWRAIGYAADVVFPDVLGGMKRVDELGGAITGKGDFVVEVTPEPTYDKERDGFFKEVEVPTEMIPAYGFDVGRLVEVASQDEILAANGGQFPLTPEQVNATVHNLVMSGKLVLENETEPAS
jgi:hypothetical protein